MLPKRAMDGSLDRSPTPSSSSGRQAVRDRQLSPVASEMAAIDDDLRQRSSIVATMNWVPSYMQTRYTSWISLNGDWLISRQRFFGVPIPLWYPLDAAGEPVWDQPMIPSEDHPDRPVDRRPRRLRRGAARPGRRLHGRTRHHGHLGDVVAHAADRDRLANRRGPLRPHLPDGRPPQARHHPDLAVLDRCRAHFDADNIPWKNCASTAGSSIPIARRCRSRRQRRRPHRTPRAIRLRRRSLLGVVGSPRRNTAFDEGQIGRRLSIKLLNAKFVLGFGDTVRASTRKVTDLDGRCSTASAILSTRRPGVRWLRLRPVTRTHRVVLLVVHRQLHGAGQGPRLRRVRRARRVGSSRCAWRCRHCIGSSPRSCPSSPKRSGAGGRTRPSQPLVPVALPVMSPPTPS